MPTDIELVRRARHGDLEAFHGLVDRYASYLYGLAVSLCGHQADAEDVVQETLAGAYRGLGGFAERSSVKTWLTRILVRQAAGHFRRRAWRSTVIRLDSAPAPQVAGASEAADVRMDVQRAILDLSPEHREVIVLREMQGLTYDEIARELGVPRGTVESRLHRARRELARMLTEYRT